MTDKDSVYDNVYNLHNYNVDIDNREIYIHSYLNGEEEHGIDYRVSNQFIKNMSLLESLSGDDITIYLNSHGGDWLAGMSMYDKIKASKCDTTIIGHGDVSSTASMILQAGGRRYITKHTWMVIHYGSNSVNGSGNAIKNGAQADTAMYNQMIDLYVESIYESEIYEGRTKKSIKEWLIKKIEKEVDWWLNSEQVVFFGFADGIWG